MQQQKKPLAKKSLKNKRKIFKLFGTGINELIHANNKMIKSLEQNKDFEYMLDKIVEKARNNCPVGLTGDHGRSRLCHTLHPRAHVGRVTNCRIIN